MRFEDEYRVIFATTPPPVLYRDELISFHYWKWAGADSLKKITLYLETLRWHNCCWMVEQTWNLATTKATTLSTLLLVLAIYLFFDSCSKYYGATLKNIFCLSSCTEGSLDGEHGTIEQHRAPLCRRECRGKFLCLRLVSFLDRPFSGWRDDRAHRQWHESEFY